MSNAVSAYAVDLSTDPGGLPGVRRTRDSETVLAVLGSPRGWLQYAWLMIVLKTRLEQQVKARFVALRRRATVH